MCVEYNPPRASTSIGGAGVAASKGFVNKAKSGTRALTAGQRQQAARARIERQRPPVRGTNPRPPKASHHRSLPLSEIKIERNPPHERLEELGVLGWPIWTKEASTFPWSYDTAETCYFLAGAVEVTPDGGDPVRVGRGDLVRFPAGLSCTWHVKVAVRKHYLFE